MNRMLVSLALAAVLALAACGGDDASSATTVPGVTTTTTTAAPGPSTSSTSPSTTTAPTLPTTTTTSSSTTTTSVLPAPDPVVPLPPLADGRPGTFLAVTDDFEAVEVDTLTGRIIRSIGQAGTRAELEAAEAAAAVNVTDKVWRTIDGSRVVVSECCEPAAGALHVIGGSDRVDRSAQTIAGWGVGVSPTTTELAIVGYSVEVGAPGRWRVSEFLDPALSGFPSGSPAWSRDGRFVYWWAELAQGNEIEWAFVTLDLETGEISSRVPDWVPQDSRLTDLATRASGELVSILTTDAFTATEGVVISPAGDLVERFPIEDDSLLGNYDPAGVHLIYVDGAGTARWLSGDSSGVLGTGFLFASW